MSVLDLWCWLGRHSWEFLGLASFGRGRLERCKACRKSRRVPVTAEELEDLLRAERRFVCHACRYEVEAIGRCPRCHEPRHPTRVSS